MARFKKQQFNIAVLLLLMVVITPYQSGQASDIEIYKSAAKAGEVIIVMMLDTSGSMDLNNTVNLGAGIRNRLEPCDLPSSASWEGMRPQLNKKSDDPQKGYRVNYCLDENGVKYLDRISRLKEALYELATSSAIQPNTKIGIGTFPYAGRAPRTNQMENNRRAYMRIAADQWGAVGSEQRRKVLHLIRRNDFVGRGSTPTSAAYAEAAAYMLGTHTGDGPFSGVDIADQSYSANLTVGEWSSRRYQSPLKQTKDRDSQENLSETQCDGKGIYFLTDGEPQSVRTPNENLMANALKIYEYHITDKSGLSGGRYNRSGTYFSYWGEIGLFARYLNDPDKITAILGTVSDPKLRTAVVGFGSSFDVDDEVKQVLSDPKTQRTRTYYNCNAIQTVDARNACNWGEKSRFADGVTPTIEGVGGYGEGGFYSAKLTGELISSIVNFIEESKPNFDPLITGIPSIPLDPLNPIQLHPFGYYATFVPKPETSFQLWLGNLNKYPIHNGELFGADKRIRLIAATGEVNSAAQGGWGGGGVKMKLPLGLYKNPDTQQTTEMRKVFSNRRFDADKQSYEAAETLSQVTLDSLLLQRAGFDKPRPDQNKNYWLNLLGFRVPETSQDYSLVTLPKMELRQLGASLHSRPILLTQTGRIFVDNGRMKSANRQDYLLFGSTQGVLHVVDDQGKEVLAFVPYEMMERQKQAFLSEDSSMGGVQKLFYGIDAPWTARSQYVTSKDGTLTVNDTTRQTQDQQRGLLSSRGMQWVYGGLRMGGRSYYSLDLTDLTRPVMKFQIDPAHQRIVSTGLEEVYKTVPALQFMGQSWSKPTIAYVKWGGVKRMVMFVGGGYDAFGEFQCGAADAEQIGNDDQPRSPPDRLNQYNNQGYECPRYEQSNAVGAGVYMFDANNGQLLWWSSRQATEKGGAVEASYDANLKYSVVSQINTLDRDNDGLVDTLYFGDLGGQAFRIDLDNAAQTTSGFAKRVVQLYNGHLDTGLSPRFYEMPSFSVHKDKVGLFGVVALTSGNLSSPLASAELSAQDGVFVIYDHDVARSDLYSDKPLLNHKYIRRLHLMNTVKGIPRLTEINRRVAPNTGWWYPYSRIKGDYKGLSEIFALDNMLYANVYDRNGKGLGGGCGASVLGDSYLFQFCLPTGKCRPQYKYNVEGVPNRVKIGAGILGTHLGKGYNNRDDSLGMILNREKIGENCTQPEYQNNPECQLFRSKVTIKHLRWYEQRADS